MSEPAAPRLSVVIPTRDTRELTMSCLASLRACARDGLEVIVVDDASSDGTGAAVASSYPDARLIRVEEQVGFTAAANRGLAAAHGRIMLLLNSDTELAGSCLNPLADAFEGDPTLGAAGAELYFPDGTPQWSAGRAPTLAWLFALASGLPRLLRRVPGYRWVRPLHGPGRGRVEWVGGAAMAISREAWTSVGPFDESYRFYCQDLDFCLRLQERGWRVEVVPGFRILHHQGASVAQISGSTQHRFHPEFLWVDLLRWAGKGRGSAWQRRAARVVRLGTRMRIAARRVALPFVRGAEREAWRRDTRAFEVALAAIGRT
jgi:GT2 family glycosyltransferase